MPQIFPRSANDAARISILAGIFLLGVLLWLGSLMHKSGYRTGEGVYLDQPVPFSHEHHVRGLGLDCRYCHTSVETSTTAGIPPVATCMNCHRQIWTNSEMLEPIREAWRSGVPIQWERVHDLPDFVYFNHSVHVAKGIGCSECHGQVDEMPLTLQVASLDMQWCLQCHRDPAARVRPREEVFNLHWDPRTASVEQLTRVGIDVASLTHAADASADPELASAHEEAGKAGRSPEQEIRLTRAEQTEFRRRLAEQYDVHSLMSCSVCHR
jgi:hypothetical protein